jgi:hypothetical protein
MIPDLNILSDDESMSVQSEADYSGLEVDLRAKSDSDSPHMADSELADVVGDGNGFGSGTTDTCDGPAVHRPRNDDDCNNGVVDNAQLRLTADRLGSASSSHVSIAHHASITRVDTDTTQESTNDVDPGVPNEFEDRGSDFFAEGSDEGDEDNNDTRSTKRSKLFTVSDGNPAFGSNMSQLQDDQPDHAQTLQLDPAAVYPHQSDLKNDYLPKLLPRRGAIGHVRRERPRATAPIGLASTASTIIAALETDDREEAQSHPLDTAPDPERRLRDVDLEMVDDGSADDPDDGDYADESSAAGSQIGRRPRSRKWVGRTKVMEDNEVAALSTYSINALHQATADTSSSGMQESEEIPIRGYLTLKTMESKVIYCLTFSQELLPEPSGTWPRQDFTRGVSTSCDRSGSKQSPVQERAMPRPVRNSRFTIEEDDLLVQLKGDGLSWDEISDYFPHRSKGTLQVHYSTTLKRRSKTSRVMKKRQRNG